MLSHDNLRILSFNARSIRKKIPSVMLYLVENDIHLAFIQETWLRKSDGNLITQIKEYGYDVILYRKSRRLDLGGGVALIFKKNLKVQNTKLTNYGSFEHITCKVHKKSGPLSFVNIYRPEYTAKHRYTVKKFISQFNDMMSDIQGESSSYIFVGDFNLHVELVDSPITDSFTSKYTQTKLKDAKSFISLLEENDFKQIVNEPTHEKGGTLDLVFIQNDTHKLLSDVFVCNKDEVCSSDHSALNFTVNVEPCIEDLNIQFEKRDYTNLDIKLFCNDVEKAKLLEEFPKLTLNECVSLYNSTLRVALDKQCPLVTLNVRSRPRQKWYNSSLRDLKRKRRAIERQFKKHKTWVWKDKLNEINLEYKMAINNTRDAFNKSHLQENKSDSRKVHSTVNYLTGNIQSVILPSCDNKLQLANDMTKYFSTKIHNIRKDIYDSNTGSNNSTNQQIQHVYTQSALSEFEELDMEKFHNIFKVMNNKPHPNDPIPVWLLNSCIDILAPVLLYIINRSLHETFPDPLKHAVVRPKIKEADLNADELKSYRPLSNLPFLSKLIEKCANSQIQTYLQNNKLYPKYQSAYRKGHSCETALIKVVNDVQKEISSRKMVAMVLLDLSSAFDTIDHHVLLQKLQNNFGITGSVLNWLKSYLTNRTFAVRIANVEGQPVILIYGVPQGSILGPLLFVLYIHDVVEIAERHGFNAHLYADDCELYIGFNPLAENTSNALAVQACFHDIKMWMQHNFLKLNIDKTKVIFFGRYQELNFYDTSLNIEGTEFLSSKDRNVNKTQGHVKSLGYVKSLGVLLDNELKMDKMVSQCVKTCYSNLKKFQTIRNSLDKDLRLMIVVSCILSRIDYCNGLLANASLSQIKRLQKVLNACMRFVYNLPYSASITSYLKQSHILPIKQRIQYKSCIIMYQIVNNLSPDYLSPMAFPDIGNRDNLRSGSDTLRMTLPDCKKCIQHAMIVNWNDLPHELRCIETLLSFKKQLKTYYFISAYDNYN